jgi:hypothetical protein
VGVAVDMTRRQHVLELLLLLAKTVEPVSQKGDVLRRHVVGGVEPIGHPAEGVKGG